jgi:hypothetical protein
MKKSLETMMPKQLPPDSTIATVWPFLTYQRPYVAAVRHKMKVCAEQHGSAHVLIGITGTGQKPCYRITYKTADGEEAIYGSWWDNGDPLQKEDALNTNWSTASMDFAQLDSFFKEKINWKAKA